MYTIRTLNDISPIYKNHLSADRYAVGPDAILVRGASCRHRIQRQPPRHSARGRGREQRPDSRLRERGIRGVQHAGRQRKRGEGTRARLDVLRLMQHHTGDGLGAVSGSRARATRSRNWSKGASGSSSDRNSRARRLGVVGLRIDRRDGGQRRHDHRHGGHGLRPGHLRRVGLGLSSNVTRAAQPRGAGFPLRLYHDPRAAHRKDAQPLQRRNLQAFQAGRLPSQLLARQHRQ